jgi:hypothetical protein
MSVLKTVSSLGDKYRGVLSLVTLVLMIFIFIDKVRDGNKIRNLERQLTQAAQTISHLQGVK